MSNPTPFFTLDLAKRTSDEPRGQPACHHTGRRSSRPRNLYLWTALGYKECQGLLELDKWGGQDLDKKRPSSGQGFDLAEVRPVSREDAI
ncbi:hypothetical protein PGT21_027488 [Puccinia graminis f. sp. tritici]|uniref:Uncharacterized protein n=1 Tax=Puccinia graminis f. sp. tritici TaxID=56615 RepID=A0A5B0PJ54_PUCGR|nr:hypothetical protein PGT21_027488 [Puccinia graminis f. sp. tritici]